MIFQRVVIAALFPLVAGFPFYPISKEINTVPLCHDTYDKSDFSRNSEVDVKKFLAINKMCPVQLPVVDNRRKMTFTLNPFKSDSMTISDGIIFARYMLVRGFLMARVAVSRGVGRSRRMLLSANENVAQKYRTTSSNVNNFCSEPFTFADHIMPEGGGFSNGIALIIAGIFAITSLALKFHQRTLAKLLKDDKAKSANLESDLKKNLYFAARQEAEDHWELEESSEYSKATNEAIEQKMFSSLNGSTQDRDMPSITEEQTNAVSTEKGLGRGETSSEGSESGSTFLETPPPTPPRYMIDLNMKKASKASKDEMTVNSASPRRKRRFGLKLRRKNKTNSTE
jgi:hypothetical protein